MYLNLFTNNNIKNNILGLRENRLIYQNQPGQEVQTRIMDFTQKRPSPEALEKGVADAEKKLAENGAALEKRVAEYNKRYGETPWFRKKFGKSEFYEQKLILNFKDPDITISQIDSILTTPYTYNGISYKITEMAPSAKRADQANQLKKLKQLFEERKKLIGAYNKVREVRFEGYSTALVSENYRVEAMRELEAKFEKNPNYKRLEAEYEKAFGRFLENPELSKFYKRADGTIDPYKQRESKQLFFAILARETNNFSSDFVLSNFTENDPEANKKNYPHIYTEWVKTRFDVRKIDSAKAEVENKTREAGLKTPDEHETKITDMVKELNAGARAAHLPSVFKDPSEGLEKPKTGTSNENYKDYYDRLGKRLNDLKTDLRLAIGKYEDDPGKKAFVEKLKKTKDETLPKFIALAEAQYTLALHEAKLEKIDSEFVKPRLNLDRQILMELAMMQFQKAMSIVDTPFEGQESWHRNLHPAVRRMLIAMIYKEGVARFTPTGEYKDDVRQQYKWMFGKLVQSKYFNPETKDRFLDPEQREFLIVARYANLAFYRIKYMETEAIPNIQKIHNELQRDITEKNAPGATPARRDELNKKIQDNIGRMGQFTLEKPLTEANVLTILARTQEMLKHWKTFYNEADKLLTNPDRVQIRAFIEKMKKSPTLKFDEKENEEFITNFGKYLEDVDLIYNTFDLKERGSGQYLERMGINPEGVYRAYLLYFKKHPEMKTDQWDNHLRTAEGTKKLFEMFKSILPASSVFKGREYFLQVFATLNGVSIGTKPAMRDSQAVAMNIYQILKNEMRRREQIAAATAAGNDAAVSKLQGMTFGDRITETAKGVYDMLMGPGQSIANRVAGGVLIILAYKAAKSAYKGDTNIGKLLRVAFVAGSVELVLKNLYGEGLTDKLKLDGLADALGGTYESVLLDRAKQKKTDITETEHSAALMELRNVPFDKLVEWYEATDIDGNPPENPDKPPKGKEKLPSQINIINIARGSIKGSKEKHAKRIIKRTLENFFGYVGNKEDKDADAGKDILKEIWIKAIRNPKYKLEDARFATRNLPPELIASWRKDPRPITWQMVMQVEIRPEDVERVKKKGVLEAAKDKMAEAGAAIERWTRRDLEEPLGARASKFKENVGTRYWPSIKNFLGEMGEAGATKLSYGARHVELWYEGNKYEIKRFAKDHWDLVVEGVKLPLLVLYGADKLVVPTLTTKLKQMREILSSKKLHAIPTGREMRTSDIMKPDLLDKYRAYLADMKPEKRVDIMDEKKNPQAHYFGLYQIPFYKAWNSIFGRNGRRISGREAYYVSSKDRLMEDGPANIGYYISETTEEDAKDKIKSTDPPENKLLAMTAKSYEQAQKFYENQGVPVEMIHKYMSPIHSITAMGPDNSPPYKLYTFWRMPLPGSEEYLMKELGRWTDYPDANEHKFRPPFMVDPSKGVLENLKIAFGARSPAVREGFSYVTIGVSEWLRLMIGTLEASGTIVGGAGRLFMKDKSKLNWLADLTNRDEKTLQAIDEYLGSAAFPKFAMSDFYKNEKNAKIYNQAAEFARTYRKPEINLKTTPDGKNIVWTPVKVDTGKKTPTGKPVYKKVPVKEGSNVLTEKIGRLNPDDYINPTESPE